MKSELIKIYNDYFIITVCCLSNGKEYYFGLSPGFKLNEKITERLLKEEELSKIAEEITGEKEINKKRGLISTLSNGTVKREDLNYYAVLMALSNYNIRAKFRYYFIFLKLYI